MTQAMRSRPAVLILDDEVETVRLCERVLRDRFRLLSATSGSQALELAADHTIAVALVDQRMPHMTGLEFLRRLNTTQPEASRVVMTAYTDLEDIVALINDGRIHGFVVKPWDNYQLRLTVTREADAFDQRQTIAALNAKLRREHGDMLSILQGIDPDFVVPESAVDLKEAKLRIRNRAGKEVEKLFVEHAMQRAEGNVAKAARDANINRTFLHRLLGGQVDVTAARGRSR